MNKAVFIHAVKEAINTIDADTLQNMSDEQKMASIKEALCTADVDMVLMHVKRSFTDQEIDNILKLYFSNEYCFLKQIIL